MDNTAEAADERIPDAIERDPADARDVELMMLVKLGAPAEAEGAFRELYDRYGRRLGKFFYLATFDYALSADLIQDTFLKLWNARERYEASGRFATFLFQIAKNHWINVREKQLRRPVAYSIDAEADGSNEGGAKNSLASQAPSPMESLLSTEQQERLANAITVLPDKQRLVVLLSLVEGLRHRDIATILDIPEGTVKSRLFNALASLRAVLEPPAQEGTA